jgi:hypothetical protein
MSRTLMSSNTGVKFQCDSLELERCGAGVGQFVLVLKYSGGANSSGGSSGGSAVAGKAAGVRAVLTAVARRQ